MAIDPGKLEMTAEASGGQDNLDSSQHRAGALRRAAGPATHGFIDQGSGH